MANLTEGGFLLWPIMMQPINHFGRFWKLPPVPRSPPQAASVASQRVHRHSQGIYVHACALPTCCHCILNSMNKGIGNQWTPTTLVQWFSSCFPVPNWHLVHHWIDQVVSLKNLIHCPCVNQNRVTSIALQQCKDHQHTPKPFFLTLLIQVHF